MAPVKTNEVKQAYDDTIMRTMTSLTADMAQIPNLDETKAERIIKQRLSTEAMTAALAHIIVEEWIEPMPEGAAKNVMPPQTDEPWCCYWERIADYQSKGRIS